MEKGADEAARQFLHGESSHKEAGNIRTDMFDGLASADIVIADISIQNANVYYELGARHGLRDKRTVMIRFSGDSTPFDIKTDRYFSYDQEHPETAVDILAEALTRSVRSSDKDSPVYALIPNLEEQDRHRFLVVPRAFTESVERVRRERRSGDLELLATEAISFPLAS